MADGDGWMFSLKITKEFLFFICSYSSEIFSHYNDIICSDGENQIWKFSNKTYLFHKFENAILWYKQKRWNYIIRKQSKKYVTKTVF